MVKIFLAPLPPPHTPLLHDDGGEGVDGGNEGCKASKEGERGGEEEGGGKEKDVTIAGQTNKRGKIELLSQLTMEG